MYCRAAGEPGGTVSMLRAPATWRPRIAGIGDKFRIVCLIIGTALRRLRQYARIYRPLNGTCDEATAVGGHGRGAVPKCRFCCSCFILHTGRMSGWLRLREPGPSLRSSMPIEAAKQCARHRRRAEPLNRGLHRPRLRRVGACRRSLR